MQYAVLVSFDIRVPGPGDYEFVYAELAKLGLNHVVQGEHGRWFLPSTTVYGVHEAPTAEAAAQAVRANVWRILQLRKRTGEVFVFVGSDSSWASQGLNAAPPQPMFTRRFA